MTPATEPIGVPPPVVSFDVIRSPPQNGALSEKRSNVCGTVPLVTSIGTPVVAATLLPVAAAASATRLAGAGLASVSPLPSVAGVILAIRCAARRASSPA